MGAAMSMVDKRKLGGQYRMLSNRRKAVLQAMLVSAQIFKRGAHWLP
jgi:hypothetical protein